MKLLEVSAAEPRSVFYQPSLKHLEKYPRNGLSRTLCNDCLEGHGCSMHNVMLFKTTNSLGQLFSVPRLLNMW